MKTKDRTIKIQKSIEKKTKEIHDEVYMVNQLKLILDERRCCLKGLKDSRSLLRDYRDKLKKQSNV